MAILLRIYPADYIIRQCTRAFRAVCKLWIWACLLAIPAWSLAQQSINFQVDGKTYRADVAWTIKHGGSEYKGASAHTLDRIKNTAFDLEVSFRFQDDSIPMDQSLIWGFQFRQSGDIILPASAEKRSRSFKLFQRFQVSTPGNASLTITPKIWRKNAAGQLEVAGQSAPFTLGFSVTDGGAPVPVTALPGANSPNATRPAPAVPVESKALQEEKKAYANAINEPDSRQRTKALLNFIDQYGKARNNSEMVTNALKAVPLGASLPENEGGGSFSYIFNYAVKPVVDTSSVRGWRWKLSELTLGQYELRLYDLGDTVHSIKIADIGKNAPYNLPRALSPFEKIQVTLEGETRDSFRVRVSGGIPPYILYLSQNNIPRMRYNLTQTDTVWSLSKASCATCKSGKHTVEVYNHDFSTLLLRAEGAVKIYKVDYYFLALYSVLAVLVIFFAYKPILRFWRQFQYESKLREIEAWERKVEEEERARKK